MKKSFTLLLLLVSTQLFAQNTFITIPIIVLPSNPDAITANWINVNSMLSVRANAKLANGRLDNQVLQSRLVMVIKKGGGFFCGNAAANSAPLANFNTPEKTWSGREAVSFLGKGCVLPPGDYELCVQFFGNDGKGSLIPISEETRKSFSIRGKDQPVNRPTNSKTPETSNPNSKVGTRADVTIIKERPGEPTNLAIKPDNGNPNAQTNKSFPVLVKERPGEPTNTRVRESVLCDCGKWNQIVVNKIKYDPGSTITGNCNQRFQFSTSYQCNAADENCTARTYWNIKKDGNVIKTGNVINQINEAFVPNGNGSYIVTLNAVCNGKQCLPSIYILEVKDCGVLK